MDESLHYVGFESDNSIHNLRFDELGTSWQRVCFNKIACSSCFCHCYPQLYGSSIFWHSPMFI